MRELAHGTYHLFDNRWLVRIKKALQTPSRPHPVTPCDRHLASYATLREANTETCGVSLSWIDEDYANRHPMHCPALGHLPLWLAGALDSLRTPDPGAGLFVCPQSGVRVLRYENSLTLE